MSRLNNSLRISPLPVAVAIVALSSWMSGCGDDDKPIGGGKGGSATTGGSAGTATGGSAGTATGGSAGTATGGSAGMATGGSAGTATGGSAGTAGMGGEPGMAGEGGEPGMAGEGGQGVGGEGGGTDSMCVSANLSFTHVSAAPAQAHTHLPVQDAARTTLVNLINSGTPLTFTMPEDGMNSHDHTLTFTAPQLTILRNGGALTMNITSSMGGPGANMHTHTYSLECEP